MYVSAVILICSMSIIGLYLQRATKNGPKCVYRYHPNIKPLL